MRKWSSSPKGRLVLRFLRTIVAVGLAAAFNYALGHVSDLQLSAELTVVLGGAIAALGKLLRDANVLPSDWSPV